MEKLWLDDAELGVILDLVDGVVAEHRAGDSPGLAALAGRASERLPDRVRQFVQTYATDGSDVFCVISGFPVDDLGATPAAGAGPEPVAAPERCSVFLRICAAVLGSVSDPADVLGRPAASRTTTDDVWRGWRTLDGGADHVGVLCLRNPDDVATTLCAADWLDWDDLDVEQLSAPTYGSRPVDPGAPDLGPRPILSEGRQLTVDPDRIDRVGLDAPSRAALDRFVAAVEEALSGLVLWPGDLALIDNRRTVHGQEPFEPRGDGTDPWFLQVSVAGSRSRTTRAPVPAVAHP